MVGGEGSAKSPWPSQSDDDRVAPLYDQMVVVGVKGLFHTSRHIVSESYLHPKRIYNRFRDRCDMKKMGSCVKQEMSESLVTFSFGERIIRE